MTPPMCKSPLTRKVRSISRSVTKTRRFHEPSPTSWPLDIILMPNVVSSFPRKQTRKTGGENQAPMRSAGHAGAAHRECTQVTDKVSHLLIRPPLTRGALTKTEFGPKGVVTDEREPSAPHDCFLASAFCCCESRMERRQRSAF